MHEHMTVAGWVFMGLAWVSITVLNVWCFREIFREREEDIVDPLTAVDREGA